MATRYVRLAGILFTKTSLEMLPSLAAGAAADLESVLQEAARRARGGKGQQHQGVLGRRLQQLLVVLVFCVHNAQWVPEGHSLGYRWGGRHGDCRKLSFCLSVSLHLCLCHCLTVSISVSVCLSISVSPRPPSLFSFAWEKGGGGLSTSSLTWPHCSSSPPLIHHSEMVQRSVLLRSSLAVLFGFLARLASAPEVLVLSPAAQKGQGSSGAPALLPLSLGLQWLSANPFKVPEDPDQAEVAARAEFLQAAAALFPGLRRAAAAGEAGPDGTELPLPEDDELRGFLPLGPAHSGLHWGNRCRLHPSLPPFHKAFPLDAGFVFWVLRPLRAPTPALLFLSTSHPLSLPPPPDAARAMATAPGPNHLLLCPCPPPPPLPSFLPSLDLFVPRPSLLTPPAPPLCPCTSLGRFRGEKRPQQQQHDKARGARILAALGGMAPGGPEALSECEAALRVSSRGLLHTKEWRALTKATADLKAAWSSPVPEPMDAAEEEGGGEGAAVDLGSAAEVDPMEEDPLEAQLEELDEEEEVILFQPKARPSTNSPMPGAPVSATTPAAAHAAPAPAASAAPAAAAAAPQYALPHMQGFQWGHAFPQRPPSSSSVAVPAVAPTSNTPGNSGGLGLGLGPAPQQLQASPDPMRSMGDSLMLNLGLNSSEVPAPPAPRVKGLDYKGFKPLPLPRVMILGFDVKVQRPYASDVPASLHAAASAHSDKG